MESPRSEKLGKVIMLSVWDAHAAFARTHYAGQETTRAIKAVQMSAGDKDRSASTASVARSRRPDHVTQPRSTNTARLICWRIWRNQVPATFSAARVASGGPISRLANYVS